MRAGNSKLRRFCTCASLLAMLLPTPAFAQAIGASVDRLPESVAAPLAIDDDADPILALATRKVPFDNLKEAIAAAVARSASLDERLAGEDEARAVRREAIAGQFPTMELSLSANRSVARNFSNDPDNVLERARGPGRVDSSASVQQLLYDFGATARRIDAATARVTAAEADTESASETIVLRALSAWYDVFAFGQLAAIGQSLATDQERLKDAIDRRIAQGVSAPVDRARIDSALATANVRLANINRELGNAAARYQEAFGTLPDHPLLPADIPVAEHQSIDLVAQKAEKVATVRAAEAAARAARSDARAVNADSKFTVVAGMDAGRYGAFEPGRNDYDVRGRITVRQRISVGQFAKVDQAYARARATEARADVTRDESVRLARIAWSDVESLRATLLARREDYIASRVTRDATYERFRYSRGTLFDVLQAQDRYFDSAAGYIRTLSEYDAARYVLLARTGQLLPALDIDPAKERQR
jgi:adhesin transport system outer membrane protein